MNNKRFYVAAKEDYTRIDRVESIEEGRLLIEGFEINDRQDGIYTPDFYCIIDENNEIQE